MTAACGSSYLSVHLSKEVCGEVYWFESAKGAECNSLGQRPRGATVCAPGALQARYGELTWS
jgi:hypothetical protein